MALTHSERLTCRDRLAEHHWKLVKIEDEVVSSANGAMVRMVEGIPESIQDICREFAKTYVSASNAEVVELDGTTAPYNVGGEYFDTGSEQNGEPIRKEYDADYWLKVAEDAGSFRWVVINEWDDVLFQSQAQADSAVAIGDAVWEAVEVAFEMSAGRETMIVPEVAVASGDTATFTSTGAITSSIVFPSTGIYATIADPLADAKVRGGTWRGGKVWTERQQNGTWTLFQTLHILNEVHVYIRTGLRKTEHTREEQRLYERIPEAHVSDLVELLAVRGSYAVADVKSGQAGSPGIFNVQLTVISVTGSGYLLVGRQVTENATEETRLYYSVPEDEVSAKVIELSSLPDYATVDSSARKTKWEGVFDVYATLVSVNTGGNYIVIGRKKTKYSDEETRLYPMIKESAVTSKINSVTTLGGYSLVASMASKTKWEGIYDVRLTVRTITGAASALLIGGTGGIFKTDLYVLRRVADADLAGVVTGLKSLSLIDRVRSVRTREEGWWDVFYSQLVVPATRIERKVSHDRREVGWAGAQFYNYATAYRKYISGISGGKEQYDYLEYRLALPDDHVVFNGNQWREVNVVTTLSYSAANPGEVASSFSSATSRGGDTTQLPNGLWQTRAVAITYPWWS